MFTSAVFVVACAIGYYLSHQISHPEKKKSKLPKIKIKNLQISPNLKIHGRSKVYHIHHWVYLSLALAAGMAFYEGSRTAVLNIFQGVTLGGVLQGLRYKDRFKFRVPHHEDEESKNKN